MRAPRLGRMRVAGVATLMLVLAACGGGAETTDDRGAGFADCGKNPNTCNTGKTKKGGTLTFAIEKNVVNWNTNSARGNVFEHAMVLRGVRPGVFVTPPDLKPVLNKDLIVSAELTKTDPQVVVYKIQPNAVWSDGTQISADDFVFNWKTNNAKDCPKCAADSTAGYNRVRTIEGSDNGKTVTVTFEKPFTDWKVLFGEIYPSHIAKTYGDIATPEGIAKAFDAFGTNVPTWTGGPYRIENFQNNVSVTLVPNDKWYGKTKPSLDRFIFRIITDAAQEPTALANRDVQGMYPQPQVDMVQQVQNIPDVYWHIGKGLTWEHYDFNLANPILADKALRQAMFLAVDRKAIIAKTVGQFAKDTEPQNSFGIIPGQQQYKDVVTATSFGNGDVAAARKTLTDAGYTMQGNKLVTPKGQPVPTLRMRFTTGNAIRQAQCELFQQAVKQLGVDVKIEATDKLGETLSGGDYDIIVFAWVGSPYVFQAAEQLYLSTSESNFGKYANPQVDDLINRANAMTDTAGATELLNQAYEIMAKDAYVLPLYAKPTFLAIYKQFANVRDNASNASPMYNNEEWGQRAV